MLKGLIIKMKNQMGNNSSDGNRKKPQGGAPNFPRMRFNFTWIYILITVAVLAMFYTSRGADRKSVV